MRPGADIFTAAILTGGRGTRLGGVDKSTIAIGEGSILDRQVSLLRGLTPHILIVDRHRSRVRASDVTVIVDCIEGAGPLGGLYTALIAAPTEQLLVIACDMPFLTAPFLEHVATRGASVEAAVPRDARGRHPLCASYRREVANRLHARIIRGELRVLDAIADMEVHDIGPDELAPFDLDGRLLLNVNTPEDYRHAVDLEGPRPM